MKRASSRTDREGRAPRFRWADRLEVEPLEPRILPSGFKFANLARSLFGSKATGTTTTPASPPQGPRVFVNPSYAITAELPAVNDPGGSGNVFQSDVFVDGFAPAYSTVWLAQGPHGDFTNVAKADDSGHYAFEVQLPRGRTDLRLFAENPLHQYSVDTHLQVTRANPIVAWDSIALRAIRNDNLTGPAAARALAILHLAQNDAVAAVQSPRSAYQVHVPAPKGASAEAAAGAAAKTVLDALFPSQSGAFTVAIGQFVFGLPKTPSIRAGLALGSRVGQATLDSRANDGSLLKVDYAPSGVPGLWRPTPPGIAPAADPPWGNVTPFALSGGSRFRPPAPPEPGSAEYDQALAEVASIGRSDSTTRTADQSAAARHWSDGEDTFTNPGHWNEIAEDVALSRKGTLAQDARLFAMLDVAMADAAIAVQDAKSTYDTWRPISAIQATDPSWTPLVTTPATPSYVSAHAAYGAAASRILTSAVGPKVGFTDNLYASSGAARTFASFAAAAAEEGQSRIWAGDSFGFDIQQGRTLGDRVGGVVLARFPGLK